MKIAVIAAKIQENSRGKLEEAIKQRGHQPIILVPEDISASIGGDGSQAALILSGKPFKPHGIIHIMSTDFFYGLTILRTAGHDIPHINSAEAVLKSADKFQTANALAAHNLPHPKVALVLNNNDLALWSDKHQYPIILKQPDGAKGIQVVLAKNRDELLKAATSIRQKGFPLLVQEYIAESRGKDIRVVVVGGRAIAAIKRIATKPNEFRSNLYLGAEADSVELTDLEKRIAVRATEAIGLDLAGVDILRSNRGPLITELNSFPGFKDTEELTGVDVAGAIVDLLLSKVGNGRGEK